MGMSHGMPWEFLEFDKSGLTDAGGEDVPNLVTGYMSEEFTFLPMEHAANLGTAIGGIMVKSMPLEIEDHKRTWFIDTFGEDTVSQFDARLSEIGKAADEAGIPKKEIVMADSTKKKKEDVVEEVDEETVVEDELATDSELEDKQEDEDDEEEEEKKQEEDEEDEEEEEEEEEEDDEEKQYATLSDLEEVVQEVIKGVTEPFAAINASVAEIREELGAIRKELDSLKMTEDERVTEKVKETPAASLSSIIARTIVGQEKAQLDDSEGNVLRKAGPKETEHDLSEAGMTGINSIDELIQKQRGRSRVLTARTNGQ
jgi:chromosome segregation ATPase